MWPGRSASMATQAPPSSAAPTTLTACMAAWFDPAGGQSAHAGHRVGGGLWLADRAMRPVQTITQTAREISETDLSRRLNLHSRNELGELAEYL